MFVRRMLTRGAFLLVALAPVPALAAHFDVIYADHVDVTLCPSQPPLGCGFTTDGASFMLLVNKGPTDVDMSQIANATFAVSSSEPSIGLDPIFNIANPVYPIHPNEAIGTTGTLGSDVLPTLIQPGETYRNTTPYQVFAIAIGRNFGDYVGPVTINVKVGVGSEIASFDMHFDVHAGSNAIQYLSAARATSQSGATPVARVNWGKLKASYR